MRIDLTSGRKFLLIAGAHVLACLAFLDYVCRSFGLSEWLLLIHAPLVVAALLAAVIIAGTVTHFAYHRRGALYLAALFPAIVVTALFALDISSFATQRWLAVSLTRSLVKLWVQAWWKGEQLLPVSAGLHPLAVEHTIGLQDDDRRSGLLRRNRRRQPDTGERRQSESHRAEV